MKKIKKIISVLLAAVMIFGSAAIGISDIEPSVLSEIFSPKAEAASYSGTCGENLTWTLNTNTGNLVISGTGDMDYSQSWKDYKQFIKYITLINGVTSISEDSFWSCENLISVSIPNSVTTIEGYAFANCINLSSVEIPESVGTIGSYAFAGCTKLERINIPQNVNLIGTNPFMQCTQLTYIEVDKNNPYFFNDSRGVLFSKENNILISYPAGNTSMDYQIPEKVTKIENSAFAYCNNLKSITFSNTITNIGVGAFVYCENLTSVTIPGNVTTIKESAFQNCSNLTNIIIFKGVKEIHRLAFTQCLRLRNVVIPDTVTYIGAGAFAGCLNLEFVHIPKSVTEINDNYASSWYPILSNTNAYICSEEIGYSYTYANKHGTEFKICDGHTITPDTPPSVENIYNLGEETYGFENFGDTDSAFGHCFGMSITSSGYYIGELDINNIGVSNVQNINELSPTLSVKEPICYYQAAQGSYSINSTVAGGTWYKTYDPITGKGEINIDKDWNDVVNYVKNHNYDNKGSLQIGFRQQGVGGHAINFIRYEEVNGQPRIYVYDNNFPTVETYFYKDSDNQIRQAPYSTFSGPIDCIALRDVSKYFNEVDSFDSTRYIYADSNSVYISGVSVYPIDCGVEKGERVVFEISANVKQVTITPLVDNAEFTYLNKEYSFGNINNETVAVFKLANSNDSSMSEPEMNIVNKSEIITATIQNPSTTTISYGDAIILHLNINHTLPTGYTIKWTASNGNFDMDVSADGTTCKISPSSSGDTTFTATVYDAEGNAVSADEQTMTSKAGFFQKIIAFFKKLFGLTKTISSVFKF